MINLLLELKFVYAWKGQQGFYGTIPGLALSCPQVTTAVQHLRPPRTLFWHICYVSSIYNATHPKKLPITFLYALSFYTFRLATIMLDLGGLLR